MQILWKLIFWNLLTSLGFEKIRRRHEGFLFYSKFCVIEHKFRFLKFKQKIHQNAQIRVMLIKSRFIDKQEFS